MHYFVDLGWHTDPQARLFSMTRTLDGNGETIEDAVFYTSAPDTMAIVEYINPRENGDGQENQRQDEVEPENSYQLYPLYLCEQHTPISS
jgi:hypothetical protein